MEKCRTGHGNVRTFTEILNKITLKLLSIDRQVAHQFTWYVTFLIFVPTDLEYDFRNTWLFYSWSEYGKSQCDDSVITLEYWVYCDYPSQWNNHMQYDQILFFKDLGSNGMIKSSRMIRSSLSLPKTWHDDHSGGQGVILSDLQKTKFCCTPIFNRI